MNKFAPASKDKLNMCHPDLQILFETVNELYPCQILCGVREEKEQREAFATGKSKLNWPDSKHNSMPSTAVDVAPLPIDWTDTKRWYHFAGYVLRTAEVLGMKIKWGGAWDGPLLFNHKGQLMDLPHWELILPPSPPEEIHTP